MATFVATLAGAVAVAQTDRRLPPASPQAPQAERRVALVIGNDSYAAAALRNARNDARAMAAALREAGFTVTEQLDLGAAAMDRAVAAFGEAVKGADVAFVFYAGHGMQSAGENYLIPVDFVFAGADEAETRRRSVPVQTIVDRLAAAKVAIVVLDACRDNPFGTTRSGARGLASLEARGALVAFAAAPGQTASDNPGAQNGLFTTHLLDALREPGLRVSELFRRVRAQVYEASQGRQTPWLHDGLIGDIVLRRAPAAAMSLAVRTEPAGATIIVDGVLRGTADPELVITGLEAGDHRVVARRPGYAESIENVSVGAGAANVTLRLAATIGTLRVETTPPGAQVTIDGILRGQAPLDVSQLAPGSHQLSVTAPGFVPYAAAVDVRAGETSVARVSLSTAARRGASDETGILHVESTPAGAQVYLDGTLAGTTPLTLESVPPGAHRLRLEQRYFQPRELNATAQPRVVARHEVALERSIVALVIETDLSGSIFLDEDPLVTIDDARRQKPVVATPPFRIPAGSHEIRLRHPVAGDIRTKIDLVGPSQIVRLMRAEHLGSLTILADMPVQMLSVGGRRSDPPPVTVADLPAGEIQITGSTPGASFRRMVRVEPGAVSLLRLRREDAAWIRMRIPAGTFQMGCVPGDTQCDSDESPRHPVTISQPFELMATEATTGMVRASGVTLPAQPAGSRDDHPVVNLTWDEAAAFCHKVGGRLPTEAEWEYSARGGHDSAQYPWGNASPADQTGAADGARFGPADGPRPVGSYAPNGFGLYDMAGNVWEWVADWYGPYTAGRATDPTGPSSGGSRVLRSGSWYSNPWYLRISLRYDFPPSIRDNDVGVRCARDVAP